jgi:hypothetical protein
MQRGRKGTRARKGIITIKKGAWNGNRKELASEMGMETEAQMEMGTWMRMGMGIEKEKDMWRERGKVRETDEEGYAWK